MIKLPRKTVLWMTALLVFGAMFLVVVEFTSACRLKTVALNNTPLDEWPDYWGLKVSRTSFDQPLDSIAGILLNRDDVFRVDITHRFPNGLSVETNRFTPMALVADCGSGQVHGLTDDARVVGFDERWMGLQCPLFTGVRIGRPFSRCADHRVTVVVEELARVRDDYGDFFWMIDEISFAPPDHLLMSIAGFRCRVLLRAESFHADVGRLVEFLTSFEANLDNAAALDLRFDNMIVSCEK